MKVNKVNMIEVSDFDQLVTDTYGKVYKFQQQDGCRDRGSFHFTVPDTGEDYENDSIPEVINGEEKGVSFKAWLDRDPKTILTDGKKGTEDQQWSIDLWWSRNFYPEFQTLVNDLYHKGKIDEGSYILNIDW